MNFQRTLQETTMMELITMKVKIMDSIMNMRKDLRLYRQIRLNATAPTPHNGPPKQAKTNSSTIGYSLDKNNGYAATERS
mmetsp:Transcript_29444/g.61935  ORF Transcript_29444/g.61935 Transcript_29444/m.61935 type:complete len:80 (-) Transcript_29444:1272-1511(-)